MSKIKRIIILVAIILFTNDICHYIKGFISTKQFHIDKLDLFTGIIEDITVVHYSVIYMLIVMAIYFFKNFFKRDEY